jgi:DNA replication protein DnaC
VWFKDKNDERTGERKMGAMTGAASLALGPIGRERPPTTCQPQVGDHVPIEGETCPTCGVMKWFWIYNPFSKRARENNGWVVWGSQHCHCQPEPAALPLPTPAEASRAAVDPRWLEATFHQRGVRRRTFATFEPRDPAQEPMARAALDLAGQMNGAALPQAGVLLVGPPGTGRGHLLDALANVGHYHGWATLSVRAATLVDQCTPDPHLTGEPKEAQQTRRRAVRKVALLGVKDLLVDPLFPSELRELDEILAFREEAGLLTCFSGARLPSRVNTHGGEKAYQVARLVARVERLAQVAVYADGAKR